MERLRISDNRRYFVKADGTPFVWIADTAWTMPQRMKWDDVEYYMRKRRSQGFTVLQIVALDPERDVEMRNPAGEKALEAQDLGRPREEYFRYLDRILDRALEYGFYVLLLPVWGQLVVGDDWSGKAYVKTVTEENAYAYGSWIGKRYKTRPNILWCLGGDRQPIHKGVDYRGVWRRMAEGLASGVTGSDVKYNEDSSVWEELLLTYHACHEMETGECSTMSYWTDEEAWIRFIMLQSGHGLAPKNYELVKKEYDREHTMPVWDGEPAYEAMPTSWPVVESFHGSWIVRKRAYFSLFAGAFGYTYGHASVWCTISEKERSFMSRITWCEALDSEGSGQIKILRDFLESFHPWECVPAQELLVSYEGGHAALMMQKEKKYLCAYLPCGGNISLIPAPLAEDGGNRILYGWWFNPRSGRFYDESGIETDVPFSAAWDDGQMLCAPDGGEEKDWVLILEKEGNNTPILPGQYGDAKEVEEQKESKVFG